MIVGTVRLSAVPAQAGRLGTSHAAGFPSRERRAMQERR